MILLDTNNYPFVPTYEYYIDRDYKILSDFHINNPLLCCAKEYLAMSKHLHHGYMILRNDYLPLSNENMYEI